ncbi:MAG TPA: hypothetical protein VJ343_01520 [archaeon]|nr:hypothetical protein [archaeon]
MSTIPELEIWKQFFRRYDQNPMGWEMYAGISRKGYPELLIDHPEYGWLIKRDSQHSSAPGIGVKLGEYVNPKASLRKSGFRPVPERAMKKIAVMIEEGFNPLEAMEIIETVLAQPPTTFDEIRKINPPAVMEGPISYSHRPLHSIIGGQAELDAKLDLELERLMRRKTAYIG